MLFRKIVAVVISVKIETMINLMHKSFVIIDYLATLLLNFNKDFKFDHQLAKIFKIKF